VTVKRIVQGHAREFIATERWLENYATAKRDTQAPNAMWKKRPYGQLAKVAEAQALRMAFPEFSAGYTMEEMQGKTLHDEWSGPTIDAEATSPPPLRAAAAPTPKAPRKVEADPPRTRTRKDFLDGLEIALRDAKSPEEVDRIVCGEEVMRAKETFQNGHKQRLETLISETLAKWWHTPPDAETPDDGELEIAGADKLAAG